LAKQLQPAELVAALEERLGTKFSKPELALTALRHSSYNNEHLEERQEDNERLEFLGDAVVDLAVSQRLYERFPSAREGQLSRMHDYIVDTVGLARVARKIGLGELILLGRGEDLGGGRDKNAVLADSLEAVLAAVYLDSGLQSVLELVDRHFAEFLDDVSRSFVRDFKTRLQQLVQEHLKLPPRYEMISESGPEHRKLFEVEVRIGAEAYARGTGYTKREAEQVAARTALDMFEQKLAQGLMAGQGASSPETSAPETVSGPKDDTPG
jgi:ribonuclease-3